MGVSFIYPYALWLLLLLPAFWTLASIVPRRVSFARFVASTVARSLLIIALVGAMAGTQLVRGADQMTTVFLLDASDSVSPSLRARAEAFVQRALQTMPPGDQAAIVVFGENALVERVASDERVFARAESVPVVARTNMQEAIQLGLALFPAETQKRLVLLSDGGENAGDALQAARLAESRRIPISFVQLSAAPETEALVADLQAPVEARVGQEISVSARVESTVAQTATLQLWSGDSLLEEQQVELAAGANQYTFTTPATGQGFQRLRAEVATAQDNHVQNNQAEALVHINGPPRVLLVEGGAGLGANFANALRANSITADVVAPEAMPAELADLSAYDAVALINVPAQSLPVKAIANLKTYVQDLGRGLLMVGGDRSYGLGGYSHTPIEEALPVYMDVRNREVRPDLALMLVIDKSGSMDACHCSGPNRQNAQISREGTPKIDIAKDAVAQAAAMLRPSDTFGVATFDRVAKWVVKPQAGTTADAITNALAPIKPEGGTNVRAGLQAAEQALSESKAQIKHIILLTDGWSTGGDNTDLAEHMRANGITLSVVAAGTGSADYLQRLANTGGGRYYPAATMDEVPDIFVQETITAAGNYTVEEPFTPTVAAPSSVLEGLTQVPKLYGYNGTTPKDTATVALAGVDRAPILAQWQFGLGRSIAWTSDISGKWAKDWVQWSEFPRFAAQLIDWVLPAEGAQGLETTFSTLGSETAINVRVYDTEGMRGGNLQLHAELVGGQQQDVQLQQIAPNQYRAILAPLAQGTYLVQVRGEQDNRMVAQQTAGFVVPYSPEYRQNQQNPALLAALASATGGTEITEPAATFMPTQTSVRSAQEIGLPLLLLALLLLPLDIGLRRFSLRRTDFRALHSRLTAKR